VSGRASADVSAARWRTVWRKHERGVAVRAIARDLGIAQKTVQYYIAKGRPDGLKRRSMVTGQTSVDRPGGPSPLTDAEADAILRDTLIANTPLRQVPAAALAAAADANVIPFRRTS
jgi:hypothetical protein